MATWRRPDPISIPDELLAAARSRPVAELLLRRGLQTPDAVEAFLTGGIDIDAPGLPDLDEGVALVAAAVAAGARICVWGDYDTDGITSTTLLVDLLRSLNAEVTYFIPNRFRDGYGMNARTVEALHQEGVKLILTCDCGIKSVDEIALAKSLGLQVVVTDHHELGPELPKADAVINPKRLAADHPCYMLPGAGTAYLFARQLLQALACDPAEADIWLDLVAVGIIADVVPLTGANRELCRRGLTRIQTSPCEGLIALMAIAGLQGPPTEEDVAFQLVPRLNAAGRLADAGLGVRLLLTTDRQTAVDLAQQLDELNGERKRLTEAVVEAARAELAAQSSLRAEEERLVDGGPVLAGGLHRPAEPVRRAGPGPAIILYRPEWHEGVLGIAAARLAEEYGVPAFLMAQRHGGAPGNEAGVPAHGAPQSGLLVGSARAPEGFELHLALTVCGDHLLRYGGHAGAAGFSLTEERFVAFRAAMLEEARRRGVTAKEEERAADLAIPLEAVDRTLYDDLRRAAPFGEANPDPVLYSPSVRVLSARPIGAKEQHLRLVVKAGEEAFTAVWWRAAEQQIPTGAEFDLFYRLHLNRWQGEEILQLVIESVGAPVERPEGVVPLLQARPDLIDRRGADLALVYREFPGALLFWEGEGVPLPPPPTEAVAESPAPWGDASPDQSDPTTNRFTLRPALDLILASPPASPRLLDELIALTGAHRLILAWRNQPPAAEDRFLQHLMSHLAIILPPLAVGPRQTAWVSISLLAVSTGELELVVRLGLEVLADSHLLAIDDERGEQVRIRRRTDGKGIEEGPSLKRLRRLLGESRAFRRFLRTGTVRAIGNAL